MHSQYCNILWIKASNFTFCNGVLDNILLTYNIVLVCTWASQTRVARRTVTAVWAHTHAVVLTRGVTHRWNVEKILHSYYHSLIYCWYRSPDLIWVPRSNTKSAVFCRSRCDWCIDTDSAWTLDSRWHLVASSVRSLYPSLQVQLKPPGWFRHSCSQPPFVKSPHSSTS